MARNLRSLVEGAFVNPREGRLRAGWRIAIAVVAVALAVVAGVVGGSLTDSLLPLPVGFAFLAQFWWNVAMVVLLVAVARYVDDRTLPDLGLGGPEWWPNLGLGLLLGVGMTAVVLAVELATGLVAIDGVLVGGTALTVSLGVVLTFVFFVAVGVGEELFVRGYLLTNVAEGLNGLGPVGPRGATAVAVLTTSGLFGFLHWTNPSAGAVSTVNITVAGLFFAGAYVVTGDLGVPVGVHVGWNFALGGVWGYPVSGIRMPVSLVRVRQTGAPVLTGGQFGPEAGAVLYAALAAGVGVVWLWVRWRGIAPNWTAVAVPERREGGAALTPSERSGEDRNRDR